MALYRCIGTERKKTEYMYYEGVNANTAFEDSCEINDLYLLLMGNGVTPTINYGLELVESFLIGNQTYTKAFIYRATAKSISIQSTFRFSIARFSKQGKTIPYELIPYSANVPFSVNTEEGQLLCCPQISTASSVSQHVGSKDMVFNIYDSNKLFRLFRATTNSVNFTITANYQIIKFSL